MTGAPEPIDLIREVLTKELGHLQNSLHQIEDLQKLYQARIAKVKAKIDMVDQYKTDHPTPKG